jgi:hypothetical protein
MNATRALLSIFLLVSNAITISVVVKGRDFRTADLCSYANTQSVSTISTIVPNLHLQFLWMYLANIRKAALRLSYPQGCLLTSCESLGPQWTDTR